MLPRLAWILLLAAPVLAEDFETRYHEAYKLEVVDGKIADAAARYLDLLQAKELPAHLRAQSEFRFAVTCALLGRPDEARARLAALAATPDLPAALRPQIEEYRKSLAEVEPGSAEAKRIEELVFQLGRMGHDPNVAPPIYRDFEIMGAAAGPHLRKLLEHRDRQLREHAFRILCRMNEPGLAAAWDPDLSAAYRDFARYLDGRPEERAALETRLLAMAAGYARAFLKVAPGSPWSAALLKHAAAAGDDLDVVARAAARRLDEEERRKLVLAWISEGPDALADAAALGVADALQSADLRKNLDPPLFAATCLRLARVSSLPQGLLASNMYAAATEQPADALLALISRLLDGGDLPGRDSVLGYATAGLAARTTDGAQTARFADLLEAWMPKSMPVSMGPYVRMCADRLPAERAQRLIARFFSTVARFPSSQAQRSPEVVTIRKPEDTVLLRVAIENVDPDQRSYLVNQALSPAFQNPTTPPEIRVAIGRLLPSLLDKIAPDQLVGWVRELAPALPPEEGVALVLGLLQRSPSSNVCDHLFKVSWSGRDDSVYRGEVAVPAFPRAFEILSGDVRGNLVCCGLALLDQGGHRALSEERRRELAAFLLPRLDVMNWNMAVMYYVVVSKHPELFPLEAWIPASPQGLWRDWTRYFPQLEQDRLDKAARALVADPSKVTDTVLTFVESCASTDVKAECAARLYEQADARLLPLLVAHRDLMPAAVGSLESAFQRLKGADLAVIVPLGLRLAEINPSERLFPLAERLLASGNQQQVLQGIDLARSLGRDALVPALLGKLDSMDAVVRTKAREAIDSILELKRIKDEVSQRIRDKKLEEAGFK